LLWKCRFWGARRLACRGLPPVLSNPGICPSENKVVASTWGGGLFFYSKFDYSKPKEYYIFIPPEGFFNRRKSVKFNKLKKLYKSDAKLIELIKLK